MSWQWRMLQNLKKNWLVNSKLTWGIWRILRILAWAPKNLKNLHFNGLLLNKVDNVWAKKIYTQALENLKKLHFNRLLFKKVYNVWAKKKYRAVMFDGIEYWCNIWNKADLCFQIWHKEFSKFSSEHVQKSKN